MDVEKTMELILEQQAHAAALQVQNEIDIRHLRAVLRRELDARCEERSDELKASVDRLIEALRTGRNGGGRNPGPEPAAS